MSYPPNTDERVIDCVEVQPSGCWEVHGEVGSEKEGYTSIHQDGRSHYAHRLVPRILGVEVEGVVHHLCENRKCVNMSHMEFIPQGEHVKRHRTWEHVRRRGRETGRVY